ncbi:phosphonate C-P lyase system protein PhnG [Oceanimonas baumannii]|uniref:Alpha-D-ribose 1-methylphosphonate 5-triphosphate synthase subunit PhnG n=1 Tax=Oceanimonas baumannii TaxID=129578 RepID=A0A235CFE6_9GAMM|nr:phosphonate C-P lyase system protein PhnG [Oceanimonas baumannii]OYD23272.1 phosphonate C-P lyase system protein PhnG [Oceanimonas baumannii]TDW58584.1 alpha-D-ribose 1-methylphosphonate 5-triphosphate synthase subunit PhnG [Oceanimonas baumannii]
MNTAQRKQWMSVLARASWRELESRWQGLALAPDYELIRAPEVGLAQVRARMGATGSQFNLGDITITRAVIRLAGGELGYSYVAGRNKAHAELAAVIDGLMLSPEVGERLTRELITPLAAHKAEQEELRRREVAASKVDFFTMVRGED